MMRYVMGLDIGTTCAKGAAVSENGQPLAECSVGYALIKAGECVEQRVQDWVEAGLKLLTQQTFARWEPPSLPSRAQVFPTHMLTQ